MIKILTFACIGLTVCANVFAADVNKQFRREVRRGLSSGHGSGLVYYPSGSGNVGYRGTNATQGANTTRNVAYDDYGELGREVFYDRGKIDDSDYQIFIPTSMYVRMGGGLNISALTKKARFADSEHATRDSWNVSIGVGWNMSSYVRTELVFQESTFRFQELSDLTADYHTLNGMLYFDFLRRYVRTGDITYRRSFVPFMGIGLGMGTYDFAGPLGADGFVMAAPRIEFGMNFMLNDMIGLDIAYQHQMLIGHGFGWQTGRSGLDNVGNIMATFRIDF
ncbi:MAG: hypothetical protein J6T57_04370 [Alphaproteobacteria bacterium]|nr:hypothetical protein [Alphaproteobacteria bacterium]